MSVCGAGKAEEVLSGGGIETLGFEGCLDLFAPRPRRIFGVSSYAGAAGRFWTSGTPLVWLSDIWGHSRDPE